MKTTALPLSLLVVLLLSAVVSARILNVPEDHQTIQAGIDAAEDVDTVLVQPGEYAESINFSGKDIVVGSRAMITGDRQFVGETIINPADRANVITFANGETAGAQINGFTLTGGGDGSGGGIYCQNADPRIIGCMITDNSGSGIYCRDASPQISGCIISENGVGNGAGMYIRGEAANAVLTDCEFISNTSGFVGGGLLVDWGASATLTSCSFYDNTGENSESPPGHAICAGHSSVTLINCTIGKQAIDWQWHTSAIYLVAGRLDIINCVIWAGWGSNISTPGEGGACQISVSYSNIEGGRDAINDHEGDQITWGEGNISEDPLFVDPDNGDYHLSENSPCIDAGDPEAPEDPDGTRADMGVFFYDQNEPPEVLHPINDIVVAEDCGLTAIADLDTVFADPNGDTLSFRVFGLDQLGLSVNEEGVLFIEPALNFNGDSLTVTVSAHDDSDSASVSFLVTVTPVNDPPGQFNLISPNFDPFGWFYRGDTIHFEWTASLDPDNEPVNYLLQIYYRYDPNSNYLWSYDAGPQTFRDLPDSNDVLPWEPLGTLDSVIEEVIWWVVAISGSDTVRSDSTRSFGIGVGVENEQNSAPASFSINSVFPNPFNSSTTIRFGLSKLAPTRIGIYGLDGRLVQELGTGRDAYPPGEHSVIWNANGLPGGVYLLALESGIEMKMTKIVLLK